MSLENFSQTAPDGRFRRVAGISGVCLAALLVILVAGSLRAPLLVHAQERPGAEAAQSHGEPQAEAHEEGLLPTIAKVFNFAVLAGLLAYFLKPLVANYLSSRSAEIRQALVTAAEVRASATAQLAEIDQKLKSLPAELDALQVRGAEDVRAERARIAQAAAAERERLLEHTRREIDMRLRIARRELVEHAAQLAVDVAQARIARTMTPEDQLRLVDRYAAQLQEAR